MSYDFEFGMRGGWIPVIDEEVGDGTVLPFMKPESLVEKISEAAVAAPILYIYRPLASIV